MVPAPALRRARRRCCAALLFPLALALLLALPVSAEEEPSPPGTDEAPPLPVLVVDPVTITATRSERSVLEVPGNVTVIERETIEQSGARNVPELLRREAGIFVTNTTTNREGYTVEARGFSNGGGNGGRTLVLIDGRRVNEPNGGLPDWAFISLDQLERVEVVRGPVNALYGDNAIAGVIHLRTRRPEPGVQATLKGRTGTYDTDEGSLWLGGGEGPVLGSVFLESHKSHGYRDRSNLRARRAEAQLLLDLDGRGELRLAGGYDSQTRKRPGSLTKAEMDTSLRQPTPGSEDDYDEPRERWGQIQFDLALTEALSLRVNGSHRRRNDASKSSDPFFTFTLDRETDANSAEVELELDVALAGHRNRTIVGASFLQEDADSDSALSFPPFAPSLASDRSRRKLYGAFLQNELNLTEDLLLVLGVRRESIRYDGRERTNGLEFDSHSDEWAPKAGLTWRVLDELSLYASYARGFRAPNFDEAFGFFGFSPSLETETSKSYEVGAKVLTECLTLNVAAYHTNVHDEIFFNPLAPNALNPFFTGTNVNVDRVRHRGFEVAASVRPTGWLEIYGSYTFDDVKFTRDSLTGLEGSKLPITPRHRGNAGVRFTLPYGFEAGVNANYVGSRYLANDVRNRLQKLPKWATYDVRLGWRYAITERLTLALDATAYNVTDRRYTEFGGVSVFSPRVGYYPSPDRHYVVGAEISVQL